MREKAETGMEARSSILPGRAGREEQEADTAEEGEGGDEGGIEAAGVPSRL